MIDISPKNPKLHARLRKFARRPNRKVGSHTMKGLLRNHRVLAAIEEYKREHTNSPSIRSLVKRTGLRYTPTYEAIKQLERDGFITRPLVCNGKSRLGSSVIIVNRIFD